MTNRKSTKRALFTSVISLLICCSMMIGTTFAWFTDSVVSGSNVIKTGNLDLEVEYTLDGENWKNLDGANDLFQKGLWEPGHTEVVALRIKNVGSLALKYVANMNILNEVVGKNETGGYIVLSDILTVSTLTQAANDVGEIALMLAYMGENRVAYETTASFKAGNVLKADQELLPGDAHYLFIKVDMAETVGNEANHDGVNVPSIEFGINVFATQQVAEQDSFGNDYDKNAGVISANPENVQEAIYAAQPGETIYLADGRYDALMLKNADGSAKNGITIKRDKPGNAPNLFSVDFIDLNGAQNVTISGICFNVTGAQKSRDSQFYTNITGGFENDVGAKNIVIENCRFKNADAYWDESTINPSNYVPILFQENGRSTSHASNLTIKDCYVDVSVYSFARLNYMGRGNVTITGTKFAARAHVLHNTLTFTGNSSDLTIVGNTFGSYDMFDTSKCKANGWNPEKAMLSSSWQGGDIKIEVRDNTFANEALATNGNVIDLKDSYAGHYTLIFEGNTFTGGLTGMTEATAPCILQN